MSAQLEIVKMSRELRNGPALSSAPLLHSTTLSFQPATATTLSRFRGKIDF